MVTKGRGDEDEDKAKDEIWTETKFRQIEKEA